MATAIGGTETVIGGAVSATVTFAGAAPAYTVSGITPSWPTICYVDPASKSGAGFVVQFTTPAPPAGGTFDWEIIAQTASASSLEQYLDDLKDLLHDDDNIYWDQTRMTRYINRGLQKRDRDTGQNRVLIPFTTTIGQDIYTFTDLGNEDVFDMIGLNLQYNGLRYVMGCVSFTELNMSLRTYVTPFQWAPCVWARYGPQQFIVAPAPAIAYVLEVDCAQITPKDYLVALTDTDPLPAPYDAPVKYWAARLAKIRERAYDEAAEFEQMYKDEIVSLDANKVGKVPSLSGRQWGWRH